jgi:hypothetical protein
MATMVTINALGLLPRSELYLLSSRWGFLLDAVSGILAVMLYAGLRDAMVSVSRAMSATVFVWLLFHTLLGSGFDYTIPLATLMALLSVIGMSFCLLAGAWPYEVISNTLKRSPSAVGQA